MRGTGRHSNECRGRHIIVGEIRFSGRRICGNAFQEPDGRHARAVFPPVLGAALLEWRCPSHLCRQLMARRPDHEVGRKVASAAGLAESPLIVSPILSYRLLTQCELKAPVCATQQACISAMLQPLLQSAGMSVMRRTRRTGYEEPQVSNELEANNELAGRPFEPGGIMIRIQHRPAATPRSLGRWRSSKHATWSSALGV